ncbi:MAG: MaoC family dehydratase [Alphaproteobacteria bacterium]
MTIAPGHFIEDLSVGQSASYTKTVTEADIVKFAEVSGDNNPVHLDEAFAQSTMFKGRIAHGMLSAGFISTVIGTKLPGSGTIYMSQTLRFRAPVRIGDTVTATCTITEIIPEKRRAVLTTVCKVGDTVVIEGEALVMVPARGK